jgi:hypothetical protein
VAATFNLSGVRFPTNHLPSGAEKYGEKFSARGTSADAVETWPLAGSWRSPEQVSQRSNVVRLKTPPLKQATLAEARVLFARAEIGACLSALEGQQSADAAILSARCLLRRGRADKALERLQAVADETLGHGDDR